MHICAFLLFTLLGDKIFWSESTFLHVKQCSKEDLGVVLSLRPLPTDCLNEIAQFSAQSSSSSNLPSNTVLLVRAQGRSRMHQKGNCLHPREETKFLVVRSSKAKAKKKYFNSTTALYRESALMISPFQTYLCFPSSFLSSNKCCKGMVSGKRGSSVFSVIAYSNGISQINKVLPLFLMHICFTAEM